MSFFAVCRSCLVLGGSIFYVVYAAFVFVISISRPKQATATLDARGMQPPMPGELGQILPAPRTAITTQIVSLILCLANFDSFKHAVSIVLRAVRRMFFMNDNPTFLRSFLRFLNVYLIVIPLPAAFLAPVFHQQRQPDAQLMLAVVLLIIINALGDVISVRLVLKTFAGLQFEDATEGTTANQDFWRSVRNEAHYYLTVLKGAAYSLAVMIVVLALSSVLFGVQIGEFDFSLSTRFLLGAWHRVLEFPQLAVEPYWFRHSPGPFGSTGIPGLFLFGVVTFTPIVILGLLAAIWLFMMPFRIAATLPTTPVLRVVASELSVIGFCVVGDSLVQIDVWKLYGYFLTHI